MPSDRKDEALLSEIKILKERVKVQGAIIDEVRKENTRLINDNNGIEEAVERGNAYQNNGEKDLKEKIILLEHALDDEREVHKQLKACWRGSKQYHDDKSTGFGTEMTSVKYLS